MIEQVSSTEFRQTKGNHQMTLTLREDGVWEVLTHNPSTRAYNSYGYGRGRSMPSVRYFKTLADVEQAYKSWRGIVALTTEVPVA